VVHPPERYGFHVSEEYEVDPATYDEVMKDQDVDRWRLAMQSEIYSMHMNDVWTLVDPPIGVKPIGCKWIYKRKRGPDGQVR
jgi:hypothetical protein